MVTFDYLPSKDLQTARELMASRNWQNSTQVAYVERTQVLQMSIDWGQGRVEVPEPVQEIISDLHIGSGSSGYSDSDRINRILAHAAAQHEEGSRSNHNTLFSVIYAPLTGQGLTKLIEWLQAQPEAAPGSGVPVRPVDDTLSLHPNVRRALKSAGITDKDEVSAVLAHCRFMVNISGGTTSGWVHAAAEALRRAGSAEALRQQDNEANEALMARDRAWRR